MTTFAHTAPTLFLDFDGVLHADPVFVNRETYTATLDPQFGTLFEWAPILEAIIADFPRVEIVLSTSWASRLKYELGMWHLPKVLAAQTVDCAWRGKEWLEHGITPGRFHRMTRCQQIHQYVRRKKLTRWVVLDDDNYGWPDEQLNRIVVTKGMRRLSDPAVQAELRAKLTLLTQPPVPGDQE